MELLIITVVALALFFDFTNGFHDTANAIATSVATGAVRPKVAVIGAAVLNFLGAFVSLQVAATVAKGIVTPASITLQVVLAGIVAATTWNLITWRFGWPTSSSHALIGGVAGSAVAAAGWHVLKWDGLRDKVMVPSLIAPVLGFLVASAVMYIIIWLIRNKKSGSTDKLFKRLQLISGSFVAFTHGTNDAQKTMGIIALALIAGSANKTFNVPLWVIVASAAAMAAGTYVGGWRIIHTLGHKLVKLESPQGFAAELTTASILGTAAFMGFPVSTTHTVSGSIVGAGTAGGKSKTNVKIMRNIFIAWLVTIPCAAVIGVIMQYIAHLPAGSVLVTVLAVVITGVVVFTRHWDKESMDQIYDRLKLIRSARSKR